jgi:hypothetical protein
LVSGSGKMTNTMTTEKSAEELQEKLFLHVKNPKSNSLKVPASLALGDFYLNLITSQPEWLLSTSDIVTNFYHSGSYL